MASNQGGDRRLRKFLDGYWHGYRHATFGNDTMLERILKTIRLFVVVVTAVLFALKYAGVADITWWQVFTPYLVMVVIAGLMIAIGALLASLGKGYRDG